jgi:signal transduction histidine kinase
MLDLQWEYLPLVETAILAHQQTRLRAEAEIVEFITSHAWALGHNFPKFLSKPIQNSALDLENITLDLQRELLPHLTRDHLNRLARIRKVVSYLDFMAEHYSHFFTFFVGSLPGPERTRDLAIEISDQFDPLKVREKLSAFVGHYRDLLTRTNRRGEGHAAPGYHYMVLNFDWSGGAIGPVRIYYNEALFLELLINHIANSMDELAMKNGELLVAEPNRGKIDVRLRLITPASTSSDVGFLAVSIADRGPGMPPDDVREFQSKLDRILLRGETPRLQAAKSGKAEHTGSGFLINASILRSFENSTIGEAGYMSLHATEVWGDRAFGLTVELKVPVKLQGQR